MSDSLPAPFYELFDINNLNAPTNTPNQHVIKLIPASENEECSCRFLAKLFVSNEANSLRDNCENH